MELLGEESVLREGRKGPIGFGLLGLAVSMVFSGALIWARPSAVVNNSFDTGVVEIRLVQTGLDKEGRETEVTDDTLQILPGMDISRISRIDNRGSDCFVRVKAVFGGTDQLDDTCLVGIDDSWVRAKDGYFYYEDVLSAEQSIAFCEGIRIPVDFGEKDAGKIVTMTVSADAIQCRNITPDMRSETPWGEVEIVEAKVTDTGAVNVLRTRSDKKFIVQYQGEVSDLIVNEENFFGNLPELLPGDEFTDGAKLINSGEHPVRLYFRSVVEDASDVTDRVQLLIETEANGEPQVVYEGPLRAEALSKDVLLMTIPAGHTGKMIFSVFVPSDLDNTYALQNKAVQWIFSTEEIVLPREGVETGDRRRVGGYLILAGLSLGFAVRMLQRKRSGHASGK